MTFLRTAALAAAFAFAAASSAPAMTVADLANGKLFAASVNPGVADDLLSGAPTRLDRLAADQASAAARSYFDYDTLITLGALALAGGGLAAVGVGAARRKSAENGAAQEPAWRQAVMRALQAELAQLTDDYRRAA